MFKEQEVECESPQPQMFDAIGERLNFATNHLNDLVCGLTLVANRLLGQDATVTLGRDGQDGDSRTAIASKNGVTHELKNDIEALIVAIELGQRELARLRRL